MTPAEQDAYDLGFYYGKTNGSMSGHLRLDYTDKDHPPFLAPSGHEWIWEWTGTRSDPKPTYAWSLRGVRK